MTSIQITTTLRDCQGILELSWFDVKLRRPAHISVGMDRGAIEDLIGKLTDLRGKV